MGDQNPRQMVPGNDRERSRNFKALPHLILHPLEEMMPRYFFDVKNGHRLIDPSGLECRDDQDATAQATVIAAQIAKEVPGSSGVRHIAILDGTREEIGRVPVITTAEKGA
jgi:hypothetical protein